MEKNSSVVTKKQRTEKKARTEKERQELMRQDRLRQEKSQAATVNRSKNVLGIDLNAKTARSAIILSEIIGPPMSRRQKRR